MGGYLFNSEHIVNQHILAHQVQDFEQRELLLDHLTLYCCPFCYSFSSTEVTIEFQNFWNWIANFHFAQTYNRATFEFFQLYQQTLDISSKFLFLENLIRSILFVQSPGSFESIFFAIQTATEESANWFIALQPVELAQTRVENKLFETTSDEESISTVSSSSTQPIVSTMDQNATAILAALQAIQGSLGRRNVATLPIFKGDLQDPVSWLEDFERAATANHYSDDDKFQVVGGFLQGSAATWYTEATAQGANNQINQWSPQNNLQNDTSFTTRFIQRFRTHTLLTRWRHELQNRVQGPNETVDEYARSIKKLIKQVETDGVRSESSKIHEFAKGLRYDIAITTNNLIGLRNDETLSQAIDIARRVESNLQGFNSTSRQVHFSPATTSLTAQTSLSSDDAIEKITASIAKMLEPLVQSLNKRPSYNDRPRYDDRTRFNDNNRNSRPPPTCFRCNRQGHISRDCTTTLSDNSRITRENTEANARTSRPPPRQSHYSDTYDDVYDIIESEYQHLNW